MCKSLSRLFQGRCGERHQSAKLLDADVERIRQMSEAGMSIREIARKMDISKSQVGRIVRYESR